MGGVRMRCHVSVPARFFKIFLSFFLLAVISDTGSLLAQYISPKTISGTATAPAPLRQLAADNTVFGIDLYMQFSKKPGTPPPPPPTPPPPFAMLYTGAKGETAKEIERTLHYTLKGYSLHTAYRDMLAGFEKSTPRNPESGFKLNIANGLWVQTGFPLKNNFVATLRDFHRSAPASLDFEKLPEQSRITINNWISDHTQNMIKDIISPGALNSATRLVLANTIYFEAKWQKPFKESNTMERPFHRLDNSTVSVPMLRQNPIDNIGYTETTTWQAARLEYNVPMAMLIILPRPGKFLEVERMLTAQFLATIDNSMRDESLILTIPKFKFTSPSLSLKETLGQLGMKSVFTTGADLSGISTNPLFLSEALHKATIIVDEKGTIASAATVLITMKGEMTTQKPKVPIIFTADWPFIFLIQDTKTGMVLFMGRVVDPS